MPSSKSSIPPLATVVALAALAACGESPLDSGTATSEVRFAFAGAKTSLGVDVCAEADSAALSTDAEGEEIRLQGRGLGPTECGTTFRVTVPRGPVRFTGLLLGRDRQIFRGAESIVAEEDGFRVVLDMVEVEALDLSTRTLGPWGPASYQYEVAGSDARIPIGKDDRDTVFALAAGPRSVTLYPDPCVVVNGPATREVGIPEDEALLGETLFEVDCGIPGTLTVIVRTSGSGGPPAYALTIVNDTQTGPTAVTVPAQPTDSLTVPGISPGPQELIVEAPGCSVVTDPAEAFLDPASAARILVEITCSGGPGPAPPGPPQLRTGSLRIVTSSPRPPGPGEVTTFDVMVTDAIGSPARTTTVGVNDSVTVIQLDVAANPHTATLIPTGSCTVLGSPSQSATVPANGVARLAFSVGC